MLIIGIIIGFILTSILDHYLTKKRLGLNYKLLAIILVSIWLVYSVLGLFIGPSYTKDNKNRCRGFKYGFHICNGDVNVE